MILMGLNVRRVSRMYFMECPNPDSSGAVLMPAKIGENDACQQFTMLARLMQRWEDKCLNQNQNQ